MELNEILDQIIHDNEPAAIAELFETVYPIDIALAIEGFDDDQLSALLSLMDDEQQALLLEQANEDLQIRIVNLWEPRHTVEIFSLMDSDDLADILGELPEGNKKTLLDLMKASESQQLKMLLGYDERSAGGIMTTRYISLRSTYTTGQALEKIKQIGPRTEIIETLFVVNAKNELLGTADLRDILAEPEDTMLEDIIDINFISVLPEEDQEEVSLIVSKYDLKAIPVVNRRGAILGIITIDDIIDVIVEEQTEDFFKISGVGADETYDSPISDSLKRRLPWLFLNLLTASLAAYVVTRFQHVIEQVVVLAAAMPIVAGLGGNAGSQTLSVIIRSLALGEISLKKDWRYIFKQALMGLLQGLAIGAVAGVALALYTGNYFMGVIILMAMVINQLIACLFGFIIPLVLEHWKVDPAVSSSIFLTALTDVFGFLAFLGLAQIFLPMIL